MKRKPHMSKFQPTHSRKRTDHTIAVQSVAVVIEPVDDSVLARLAENIWRLARRADRESDAGWATSLIERLTDDLRDLGVEIIDRSGTPYRDGESLEVLHSDVPPGWSGDRMVTEVIAPTIRIGGHVKGRGKVVIGVAD